MTRYSTRTGQKGERFAEHLLRQKGFQIEASNWHAGQWGEIDVIAWHPESQLLVFVEVKTRKSAAYGHPTEAITRRKQIQLLRLAEIYLGQRPDNSATGVQSRFDVVSILHTAPGQPPEVLHIENAFTQS